MNNPHLTPWNLSPDDFPADGYSSDQLEFLLGYAVLAPSNHNSQPWLFRVNVSNVEIFADRRRALRAIDPYDRELTLSCGAALFNLRVAAEYFSHQYQVEILPNPSDPNLLARLHLGMRADTTTEDVLLFQALTRRRTNRGPFRADPVPDEVLAELADAAGREGAWLVVARGEAPRHALGELVAEADRRQWAAKAFREELARWMRTDAAHQADGIPAHDLGIKDWLSFAGPSLIRTFNRGAGYAAHDLDVVIHSPTLVLLGTNTDNPATWMQAGQALQSVLLHAESAGVSASHLNQPIEVAELRADVATAVGVGGFPQALLRLGYGQPVPPTPRHTARTRLIRHPAAQHG
jgi:hypothetical protein